MLHYYMPTQLYSGLHCLDRHKADLLQMGKRCLIITGESSSRRNGSLNDVTTVLEELGIAYTVYDQIRRNPLLAICMDAGWKAHEFSADFIIGIGGGSPLDAAKAIAVLAANPDLSEAEFYAKDWNHKPLPIVLVGTTSGTGSEVTKVSVLTDSKGRKHSIHDPQLFAKLAFGDPAYTSTMPLPMTLSTGIDVLAHCAESYFNKKADEISRGFSIRGIQLLYRPLKKAAAGEELTYEDREQLYEASILGGLAINTTGTCFPHNVGYYLTERYRVPHGTACAVFEMDLLDYEMESDPEYTNTFYKNLGIDRDAIYELIGQCLPPLDIRFTEEELAEILPRWENNNSVKNTRGTVTCEQIGEILRDRFL